MYKYKEIETYLQPGSDFHFSLGHDTLFTNFTVDKINFRSDQTGFKQMKDPQ